DVPKNRRAGGDGRILKIAGAIGSADNSWRAATDRRAGRDLAGGEQRDGEQQCEMFHPYSDAPGESRVHGIASSAGGDSNDWRCSGGDRRAALRAIGADRAAQAIAAFRASPLGKLNMKNHPAFAAQAAALRHVLAFSATRALDLDRTCGI